MASKAGTVTPDPDIEVRSAREPLAASKSTSTQEKNIRVPPPLPLGWTKIDKSKRKRKRKRTGAANADDDDNDDGWCCDDPTCPTPNTNTADVDVDADADLKNKKRKAEKERNAIAAEELYTTLRGKALFCLHSLDCKWFQGQFVPSQSVSLSSLSFKKGSFSSPVGVDSGAGAIAGVVKSMGMLARQRDDIDECLQCNDNGYREIDLTILPSRGRKRERGKMSNSNTRRLKREEIVLRRLTCTGGDMLRIRTPSEEDDDDNDDEALANAKAKAKELTSGVRTKEIPKSAINTAMNSSTATDMNMVRFDAEQIITGIKVEPLVRRFFPNIVPSGIISSSSSSSSSSGGSSSSGNNCKLLDYLPDCAVVVGEMTLRLPRKLVGVRSLNREKIDDDDDDNDLWKD